MTKVEDVRKVRLDGPSSEVVRKAVEVKVAPSGTAYVTPGVAAMSPKDVYRLVRQKVADKQ